MQILNCVLLGYGIGCLSPAALISKIKNKDLRREGTGNLGATNTMLTFGKGYGALVMLFDIVKSFIAVRLARRLFPSFSVAGILAGSFAVVGHVFPFYMKFKGGKGLASYGGMILALDPILFLLLLCVTMTAMLIVNYSWAMPISAGVLFPVLFGMSTRDNTAFLIATAVSLLIIAKHYSNIGKARRGEDHPVREFIKTRIFH